MSQQYFISDLCDMLCITKSLCVWYLNKQPYDITIHPQTRKPAKVLNGKTAAILYHNLLNDNKIEPCLHFYHDICEEFDYSVNSISELVNKLGLKRYEVWSEVKHRVCNCLCESDYLRVCKFFEAQGLTSDKHIESDYLKNDHIYKFNEWPDIVPDCFKEMDDWDDEELLR